MQCVQKYVFAIVLLKMFPEKPVAYPGIFFFWGGVVQQIQLRTEDKENGDRGAVVP